MTGHNKKLPTKSTPVFIDQLSKLLVTALIGCALVLISLNVMPWSSEAAPQHPTANRQTTKLRPGYVPGEILIRFKDSAEVSKATTRVGSRGSLSLSAIDRQINVLVERLDTGEEFLKGLRLGRVSQEDLPLALELLNLRSDVVYAEPNYLRFKSVVPNDARFVDQWGLQNTGQVNGTAGADIEAAQAWNTTTGSRNVVVAVIDEGVDISHQDLQANVWRNPGEVAGNSLDDDGNGLVDDINGYDFHNNDPSVYDGPGTNPDGSDIDAHGTHVAGILGGVGNNGIGVSGVNWEVSLMPLKFLGPSGGSVANSVRAVKYAKSMLELWNSSGGTKGANVRVINNSYGGSGFSQTELDAIKELNSAGILFVAAAGNEAENNDAIPSYPANYDVANVISVTSTTRKDQLSDFSNRGALSVHLGAPGSEILSTTPSNTYSFADGTSMACPHVTGTAALILAAHPSITMTRLRAAILFGAEPISAMNQVSVTGARLNASGSLVNAGENDSTAPSLISDLQIESQEDRFVALRWTAPGDDGSTGQAALYEFRFTDQSQSSPVLLGFKKPAMGGTSETFSLNVPFRHPSGSFLIRTIDNAGNLSESTIPVTVSPADLADPYTVTTGPASPLSTGGQALFMQADDKIITQSLPFSFPYYDHLYNFVSVSSNGALYAGFGPGNDAVSRPEALNRRLLISPAWDDLDLRTCFRSDSDIYRVSPNPDTVIFRWQGVVFSAFLCSDAPAEPKSVNFEVELRRDGTILMRYGQNSPMGSVVGIGGGEPEGYVIGSHTAVTEPINLTNAETITYTLRRLPKTADLSLSSTVAPAISMRGQPNTFTITATNLGPNKATQVVVTDTLPNNSTLVSCTTSTGVTCQSIESNKLEVKLGSLNAGASATISIVVEPTTASSTPYGNAATIRGFHTDPNPNNNDTSIGTNLVAPNLNPQTGLTGVGAGGFTSYVIRNDGVGLAFGWGQWGKLGDGGASDRRVPVRIKGLSGLTQIEGGLNHTIALRADGSVWTWGRNDVGQLGLGHTLDNRLPSKVPGVTQVIKVAAGANHCLALSANGTIWAWGDNTSGQLGDGTKVNRTSPVQISITPGIVSIATSSTHSLALKNDGSVWSWGSNDHGQLGEPQSGGRTTPAQVGGLSNVTSIAASDFFSFFNGPTLDTVGSSLALKSDGTVWTWGSNWRGQLGDGTMTDRFTPAMVNGVSGVTKIAAGGIHMVALRNDGTVWVWGANFGGQLGDGTTTDRPLPQKVLWLTGITAVAAGTEHTLALRQDGHVFAFGRNSFGENGSGHSGFIGNYPYEVSQQLAEPPPIGELASPIFSPDGGTFVGPQNVVISHPLDALSVNSFVTGGDHVVVKLSNGETWGWGSNFAGQLGFDPGFPNPDPAKTVVQVPIKVPAFDGFSSFATDNTHTLALKPDGTVWSWGGNGQGELGYSTSAGSPHPQPAQVPGLTGVVSVSASSSLGSFESSKSMALRNDGTVWVWGFGKINGDEVQSRVTPVQVAGLTEVTSIVAGNASFVIKNDGTVWGWGSNFGGMLGDGTQTTRSVPGQVLGLTNITRVCAGGGHGVALKTDGTVWTWGRNTNGQLGNGSFGLDQLTAVQVPGISQVVAIHAGAAFTLALKSDGTVWAWGSNNSGELGDGNFLNQSTPKQIPSLNNITAIGGGLEYGFARRADGKIFTWGRNDKAQVGDGSIDTQFVASLMSRLNGGVTIHYTTNGQEPTQLDPEIASGGSVTVGQNLTLKAKAFKTDWTASPSKSSSFTITSAPLIQFSQATASASESATGLTVDVTRSGDLSIPSSVEYATTDTAGANTCAVANGQASSRCDYLTTRGKLSFAPGEALKSITIPIIDDVYLEGHESFSIGLSNAIGATLNSPSQVTLSINDNDSVTGVNPIDTASFFVRQHYIDFLNREPDPGGLAFWTNEITSCGSDTSCIEVKRINVSAAFFLSIEFQETGYLVYRVYKAGFGNLTNPAGSPVPVRFLDFLRDTQEIGKDVQVGVGDWQAKLEANKQAYMLAFVQRPEFQSAFPNSQTAEQFVNQLDLNAGVVLSASEKANLVTLLGANPTSASLRAQVLRLVAEDSTLRDAETNRAFVLMQYFGYMRRNPFDAPDADFSGYNFWLTKLNQFNGNFVNAEMVKAFITSGEYRQRFGP